MEKPLSQWAKEKNIPYLKAWRQANSEKIPNAVNKGGKWYISEASNVVNNQLDAIYNGNSDVEVIPKQAFGSSSRKNVASKAIDGGKYSSIENGYVPFLYSKNTTNTSGLNPRDVVILCQKAYYNFPIFRNTIDLMVDFSVAGIYLTGGNDSSRKFFQNYFNIIKLGDLQARFFREYYRSGNIFIYPLNAKLKPKEIKTISQIYNFTSLASNNNVSLPYKYIILNPADIELSGTSAFVNPVYLKQLNPYEMEVLRNPKTEEDEIIFKNLSAENKELIKKSKGGSSILIKLESDKIYAVFYNKQDYEPFATPFGFPVLEDLNRKDEMKKMDMAVMRTTNQAILLITMGAELKDGKIHFNPKAQKAMEDLFKNESVSRVIVADWTTKGEFIIPQIGDILDPQKYQIINEDISSGLNNILGTGEKFANQFMKVQIFVERLKQGREAFINEFLIPEIKKISKELGFKSFPTPKYEDINLKDELEFSKIYTRLTELGVLTPTEGLEAIETGRFPTKEESLKNQEEYSKLRDKGYYMPLAGGPASQMDLAEEASKTALKTQALKPAAAPAGRPTGTKSKQTTKKVKPAGASFSFNKIKENLLLANSVESELIDKVKKKFNINDLTDDQSNLCAELLSTIIANESPENWKNKIDEYMVTPVDKNKDRVNEILNICAEFGVDSYMGGILYASQNTETKEENENV